MNTEYIESLRVRVKNYEPITSGERIVLRACDRAEFYGLERITYGQPIDRFSIPEFVSALERAEISEFYITSLTTGNISFDAVEMIFDLESAGLKLRGTEMLENPEYEKDIAQWGESWQKSVVPALRFGFLEGI